MTEPIHALPCARQHARPFGGVAIIALLLALLAAQGGCQTLRQRLREQERLFALGTARTQTQRGQCSAGLNSLDRAQAKLEIGRYAMESTRDRARCYEKLGLTELARGHRRLIEDFYTSEPMALPKADGSSVFRVATIRASGYERPPSWLKISQPRFSPSARRSRIVGRVVIAFELTSDRRTEKIRVLEMPHPLLASWAIEAISRAKMKKRRAASERNLLLVPDAVFVTTFVFHWRWAVKEDQQEDS